MVRSSDNKLKIELTPTSSRIRVDYDVAFYESNAFFLSETYSLLAAPAWGLLSVSISHIDSSTRLCLTGLNGLILDSILSASLITISGLTIG